MFARMKETDHLMSLSEAKKIFISALTPRIKNYEERLKKPWFERCKEYFETEYGELGYIRTKDFLTAINEKNICSTEDLIDLTKEKKYRQGTAMPVILQKAVLIICKFDSEHVKLIKKDLKNRIKKTSTHAAIELLGVEIQAIQLIYEKIITSKDYGGSYLSSLNHKLLGSSAVMSVCNL